MRTSRIHKLAETDIQHIKALAEKNFSTKEIVSFLGIGESTVKRVLSGAYPYSSLKAKARAEKEKEKEYEAQLTRTRAEAEELAKSIAERKAKEQEAVKKVMDAQPKPEPVAEPEPKEPEPIAGPVTEAGAQGGTDDGVKKVRIIHAEETVTEEELTMLREAKKKLDLLLHAAFDNPTLVNWSNDIICMPVKEIDYVLSTEFPDEYDEAVYKASKKEQR